MGGEMGSLRRQDDASTPGGDTDAARITVNVAPVEFWLVWTKNGLNPRHAHNSLASAQAEALRLAAKFPDRRWFVVQAVTRLWVNEAADHLARASVAEAVQP